MRGTHRGCELAVLCLEGGHPSPLEVQLVADVLLGTEEAHSCVAQVGRLARCVCVRAGGRAGVRSGGAEYRYKSYLRHHLERARS